MRDLVFRQWQAPGDLVVLTVALRDLHLAYPGMFRTQVISCYPEVFYNSPFQSKIDCDKEYWINLWYKKWKDLLMDGGFHFTDAFVAAIQEHTGHPFRKTSIWPEIYLTEEERDPKYLERFGIEPPYWIINAGAKVDMPIKQYPPMFWQEAISYLNYERSKFGVSLVQAGHSHDLQPKFDGVINLVGKTNNLRDYFALMYHSSGSVGHVSLQMHVAAAFRKPCVVIAGGREGFRWEAYPSQCWLGVAGGMLPCAGNHGCWISLPNQCRMLRGGIPQCYRMIRPETIASAVLNYHCKPTVTVV